jgi:catechol 2,3-dioxygenase-like lactoylglutathione lyase family enzyme
MFRIANAQLWVNDQDEALEFYTKKVGMEVRTDVTMAEMGDFRWLTVGPAGQPDVAIVLMAIPARDGPRERRAGPYSDGEGLRGHRLSNHRRLSSLL